VLAIELLLSTPAVQNLIREQKIFQLYSVLETSSKDGMITLDSSLRKLHAAGKISAAEARSRMRNPAALATAPAPGAGPGRGP
jgi:twitching motility protein PilT